MLIPAINLPGRGNEAIEFYKTALGAEVVDIGITILTLFGTKFCIEDDKDEAGINSGLTMNVFLASKEEVTAVFNKLAEKGQVVESLKPDHWTSLWGFVVDYFGVRWCIAVEHS
ncbi:MAG: VOC family protein [Defluviitaleaceae bacterium]|nr:VOC family protein [Defluviitaleaceae bacterium]